VPKRSVSEFFDSYSHDFSAIYGNQNTLGNQLINSLFRRSMRLRYLKSLEGCDPIEGRSVLDVGCGPGHYSVALAKKGAGRVFGVDFADAMIDLARQNAKQAGVGQRCEFVTADFMNYPILGPFDYSVVMGFMDYIREPDRVIARVLSLTRSKAFFSFPIDGGLLAWQRRLRYKSRCDLFLYDRDQIRALLARTGYPKFSIDQIARDFFVTVDMS
jgi:SAM-dependent methyltransferase